jgi:pimeloyl-ACP methyl ester carboxylesterase
MKKPNWWYKIFSLLLPALVLPACSLPPRLAGVLPDNAQSGELKMETCAIERPGQTFQGECGVLTVPENRGDPNSRLIALPVYRFLATGSPVNEPIFWFMGGPGISNVTFWPFDGILEHHDVVLVGYRGIDGSVQLQCPEFAKALRNAADKDLFSDASLKQLGKAAGMCAERLQNEGIDLEGYNLLEIIADVETVREALGYKKINIQGTSFGTWTVQLYSYLHPEVIHRAVQNAVGIPGMALNDPADVDRQIEHLSTLCARDPACSQRTPNLAESMHQALNNRPSRWLIFPLDRGKILMGTWGLLYDKSEIAIVVDAYLAAADGDYSGLWGLQQLADLVWPNSSMWGAFFAYRFSTNLDGTPPDFHATLNDSRYPFGAPTNALMAAAETWPYTPLPETYRQIQPIQVQTLMIGGSLDFATPAYQMESLLANAYSDLQIVTLSELSHTDTQGLVQSKALEHLLVSFYDTGQADDSQFTYDPFKFTPKSQWFPPSPMPQKAKLYVGVTGLGIIALLGGLLVIIRKLLRKKKRK